MSAQTIAGISGWSMQRSSARQIQISNVVVPEGFLKAGGRFKRPPPMKAAAEEEVKGSFVMYHLIDMG